MQRSRGFSRSSEATKLYFINPKSLKYRSKGNPIGENWQYWFLIETWFPRPGPSETKTERRVNRAVGVRVTGVSQFRNWTICIFAVAHGTRNTKRSSRSGRPGINKRNNARTKPVAREPRSGRIVDLPAKKWSDPARIILVHGVVLRSFSTWLGGAAGAASREITNALSVLDGRQDGFPWGRG